MVHKESSPSLQESVRENRQAEYSVSQKHFLKGGPWRANRSLPAEHSADATGIIFQHSIDIYQAASLNQALADKQVKETRSHLPLSKRQWAWLWVQCWRTSGGLVRTSGGAGEKLSGGVEIQLVLKPGEASNPELKDNFHC